MQLGEKLYFEITDSGHDVKHPLKNKKNAYHMGKGTEHCITSYMAASVKDSNRAQKYAKKLYCIPLGLR